MVMAGLVACRTSAPRDETAALEAGVAQAQEESPVARLRSRAIAARARVPARLALQPGVEACPPVDMASLRATLVRRDPSLRGAELSCVGQTKVGVVWAAERQLTQGDCDQRSSHYQHWLVLLTPEPRVVHTADSEDGGCPCASQRRPFDAVFTRNGVMYRPSAAPHHLLRYERLEPNGFRLDAASSAELEREDTRAPALDLLASLPEDASLDAPDVLAAREVMGW